MHIGVIPDGNRRYARENGIEKKEAYREAKNTMADVFEDADFPVDVEEVTFYLLSEENLKRDDEELDTLFQLLKEEMENTASRFSRMGFSFNWATTNPEAIPDRLRNKLRQLEEKYDSGKRKINALISYSGKQDILQASAEAIASENGSFDREALRERLEINSEIDYVIRTGDNPSRECLSGFPIWNASYAEYYHVKKHFPDLSAEDVEEALEHFQKLRRKKGA